ncbi:hypothetical protein J3Q64DRAFT_1737328 [Phycomyces blakesleeanus]|uniref:Uncharacterized protein n=1 Tax=Phycomyces blakesleeanus TaxID=4837 RepID=A0ABR3B232_PHYBL
MIKYLTGSMVIYNNQYVCTFVSYFTSIQPNPIQLISFQFDSIHQVRMLVSVQIGICACVCAGVVYYY